MERLDDLAVQAHAITPLYLAAHGTANVVRPLHEDVGMGPVVNVARRCADVRGTAGLQWVPGTSMDLAANPWREVYGLVGSIGESLVVAAACEIEVEWHRRARAVGDLPPAMVVGQRFFSIAEGQEVLGVGHRLVNLVARVLATRDDVRATMQSFRPLKRWQRDHFPFDDGRSSWLSADSPTVEALARVAAAHRHPSFARLADAVQELVRSAAWKNLEESRGQNFHRWRAESSVLAGVDRTSGHQREIVGLDGTVVGLAVNVNPVRYSAADGLDEEEARLAREALLAVATGVAGFIEALAAAMEPLTFGHVRAVGGRSTAVFGQSWDETKCTCCNHDADGGS